MKKIVFKETEHFWILFNGKEYVVGLTKLSQQALKTATHLELPKELQAFQQGEPLIECNFNQTVSKFVSPLTGVISSINEKINQDMQVLHTEDELDAWVLAFKDVEQDEFIAL
ncbi:glycine cleavage system H protein [Enterococcus sp. DIV2402]|uniref:Glycine cleavage system H protein n=1 Tax=Candidatus Enterococcus lowellii TaxID=2230877 RepID=A0ABZ2SVC5_9ENTE|nr:glycine cleavage system protein H [Enterococcus sp. DIV2402]MBO0465054.1 glycine cleavage system protein H [Enterococcus sp. DIV2402]